jgi:hypothetical protein
LLLQQDSRIKALKLKSATTNQSPQQVNLTNSHLPPVMTVTLYSGMPPVTFLRERITLMLMAFIRSLLSNRRRWAKSFLGLLAAAYGSVAIAGPDFPIEDDVVEKAESIALNSKFTLGVALSINRFNSSYKFKQSNKIPIFIDGEGLLGLPESNMNPLFYGAWRINSKHGVGFHTFSIDREGSDIRVNNNFGDVSIDGKITASDKSSFYYLNYSYTFKETRDIWIKGLLGIYALDLEFQFDAVGDIEVDGVPVVGGKYTESFDQFAPLPMVGLQFWTRASPRWALGARMVAVAGKYQDVQALVIEGNITARYQITSHVGLLIGGMYFNGEVDITQDDERASEIKYGYDGFFMGIDFNF